MRPDTGRRARVLAALVMVLLLCAYTTTGAIASRSALILVDTANAGALAPKLDRWVGDLKLLGWQARWQSVAPDTTWPAMATFLQAAQAAAPYDHLALVGRVPWYWCWPISPDGHPERPWVADAFYASNGAGWHPSPADPNVLYENVFYGPNNPTVAVGRIDARALPSYAAQGWSEEALLSAYLDKAHAWRTGAMVLPVRGLVSDHCSTIAGPGNWAGMALLNVSVLTPTDITQRDLTFIEEMDRDGGMGAFLVEQFFCLSSANFGPDAAGYFATHIGTWQAGWATIYVSYTADWFNADSWLRGAAMNPLSGLGTCWGIGLDLRPLATGSTVGECFLTESKRTGMVVEAWMGDPTLVLKQGLPTNPPPVIDPSPREPPKWGPGGKKKLRALWRSFWR